MVEFERVRTGVFVVKQHNAVTKYQILNGDLGASGRGANMYGIQDLVTQKITWVGSLQKCKKTVKFWLTKI